MILKNTKTLRKSPASNVWAAVLKNADFFVKLFKIYKID